MNYQYTEKRREEYNVDGLTVLRNLIPVSLLHDLRLETDKARELARTEHGGQAQRIQPVYKYPELRSETFREFLQLDQLQKTVREILGEEHHASDHMGVLFEPEKLPWATNWHRDWAHHVPTMDFEAFYKSAENLRQHNQLNGALYEDGSLWVVPGSHNRRDTSQEVSAFSSIPTPGPVLANEMTATEREMTCLAYARQMPGAVQVLLNAGDVAFYRACCWHIGFYVPYRKRATLHDGFYCPDDFKWRELVKEMK